MNDNYMLIHNKLLNIIEENIDNVNIGSINAASTLTENVGMDSVDLYSLVMEIEESFGIEIQDSELDKLITFGDLIEKILETK